MFGCHKCIHRPQKNEIYEETECARCRAARDPALLGGYGEDSAKFRSMHAVHPAYAEEEYPMELKENYCREDLAAAVSQTVRIILRLKSRSHSALRILEMKLDRPELSYSQLADIFSCRKQNIQYHLHKVLRDCPELRFVLGAGHEKRHRRQERRNVQGNRETQPDLIQSAYRLKNRREIIVFFLQ